MKRLAIIMMDLIPLALAVIFVIAVVLTFSHVTHNSAAAVNEAPSKPKLVCPANAVHSEIVNEAARSGELDRYINSEYP